MPDVLTNFDPLYADQDENTILARWRGWANEGLDPSENQDEWTDVREGSHWFTSTTPMRRESARLYDLAGSEVPAAAFPQTAWGPFLDNHGELRGLGRLSATAAGGEVTITGENGTEITAGFVVGVEPAEPGADAPEFEVTIGGTILTGSIDLPVRARVAGISGDVGAGAIRSVITPLDGVTAVTNAAATQGGTDTETDLALRARILEAYLGPEVANALYYRQLALNWPGIGRATVIRGPRGAGTIGIIVATAAGDPVSDDVLDGFQNFVDPVAGQGAGSGQVGAEITVSTASTLTVDVDAIVEFEPGYSLDGDGGTTAMRAVLEGAITSYVDAVQTGTEVVHQKVVGRIISLTGLHDVGRVTLNRAERNIAVTADPPIVPTVGRITLTAADV